MKMKMKMYCYLQEGINPVTELIEVPLLDNKQVLDIIRGKTLTGIEFNNVTKEVVNFYDGKLQWIRISPTYWTNVDLFYWTNVDLFEKQPRNVELPSDQLLDRCYYVSGKQSTKTLLSLLDKNMVVDIDYNATKMLVVFDKDELGFGLMERPAVTLRSVLVDAAQYWVTYNGFAFRLDVDTYESGLLFEDIASKQSVVSELNEYLTVEYLRKHKPTKEVKENSFGIIVGGGPNDIRQGDAMRELLDRIAKLEEQVTELSKGKE